MSRLRVCYNNILRKMLGVPPWNRVRNMFVNSNIRSRGVARILPRGGRQNIFLKPYIYIYIYIYVCLCIHKKNIIYTYNVFFLSRFEMKFKLFHSGIHSRFHTYYYTSFKNVYQYHANQSRSMVACIPLNAFLLGPHALS